jgi:hypothetical protein
MLCGVPAGRRVQSGSDFRTLLTISPTESPSKAGRPVSISNRTQPNAQTSLARSASCAFACSGLM